LQNGATKGNTDEHNGKGDKELTSLLLAKFHLEVNLKMKCFPRVSITEVTTKHNKNFQVSIFGFKWVTKDKYREG
jgi:hypothetical protein